MNRTKAEKQNKKALREVKGISRLQQNQIKELKEKQFTIEEKDLAFSPEK